MSGRFTVDLLHPGRVARTWKDWFVGPQGRRRLLIAALGCLVVWIVVGIGLVLPPYLRLSEDRGAIPRLRRDLGAIDGDLNLLRTDLRALATEAKRQVRWGELLNVLGQQVPPTLKLQKVEIVRAAPPPGQPAPAQPDGESQLRIEALTPLRPGSPPLLEIAQFMAGLLKDPAVSKRFQLKSWEIKPPTGAPVTPVAAAPQDSVEGPALQITIVFSELGR
jgi:hypothetical protein